ncbi:MAG: Na/Pi cotransporter family protein [Clostridia bacterium]|nr:Na/Pi cotransporter family protein [Clostridia bacterium]
MTIENWLGIIGGIAIFLFGIKIMGNGIERLAGAKLKSILEKLTTNRFLGLLVGTVITGIIQSSNAVSVMTVGFVNAGLMPLENAVGVIMGANVGTTITGQLIAFNIDTYAPIIAFAGVMAMTFLKKRPWNDILYALTGLGLLFMGMMLMKEHMLYLKNEAWFVNLIANLNNPLLAVLVGTIMTMLLQSVSASVGVLQAMAMSGALGAHPLTIAVYLICGQNIGCTMVSILASVGGTKDAKRTACIHVLFNVFACLICILLLQLFPGVLTLIERISGSVNGGPNYAQQLANANTFLKIAATLIMFPLSSLLIKLSRLIIRGEDKLEGRRLIHIVGGKDFGSSVTAVASVEKETERMYDIAHENLQKTYAAMTAPRKNDLDGIGENEETLDWLNSEISKYLVEINRNGLGEADARSVDRMHHVIVDYERIGDHVNNIAGYIQHMREKKINFSEAAMDEIAPLFLKVLNIVGDAHTCMQNPKAVPLSDIARREQEVDDLVDLYENNHIKRLSEGKCSAEIGMLYVEALTDLERISDHALNIAEAGQA